MYNFRLIYSDGSYKDIPQKFKTINTMFWDFDGLISWDTYETLNKNNITSKRELELAFDAYSKKYGDFCKVEIINSETYEVIDCLERGKND